MRKYNTFLFLCNLWGFVLIIHGDINLSGGFENPFYLIQFCLCSETKDIRVLIPY